MDILSFRLFGIHIGESWPLIPTQMAYGNLWWLQTFEPFSMRWNIEFVQWNPWLMFVKHGTFLFAWPKVGVVMKPCTPSSNFGTSMSIDSLRSIKREWKGSCACLDTTVQSLIRSLNAATLQLRTWHGTWDIYSFRKFMNPHRPQVWWDMVSKKPIRCLPKSVQPWCPGGLINKTPSSWPTKFWQLMTQELDKWKKLNHTRSSSLPHRLRFSMTFSSPKWTRDKRWLDYRSSFEKNVIANYNFENWVRNGWGHAHFREISFRSQMGIGSRYNLCCRPLLREYR